MSEIPDEFAEFVRQKQKQLLTNVLTSAAAAVALANLVAFAAGDASVAVLATTARAQAPLLAIAAVASVFARKK